MKNSRLVLMILPLWVASANAAAVNVNLGSADAFAVLAGSTVTNTGLTAVTGNLGVSPGTAVTGFPPGVVNGTVYGGGAVPAQAQTDLTSAYNFAAGETGGTDLTGQNLGGLFLTPGVYSFSSSAQLTGTVTLDAQGNPNAVFVFQIGSTLTTASASSVALIDGSQGDNIFWQVGSSATLGTGTSFEGNILALTSITLTTGADIGCGRALARNGAVTLDSNIVSACEATSPGTAPEPGTSMLLGGGLFSLILGSTVYRRKTHKVMA